MLRWIAFSLMTVSTLGCVATAPTHSVQEPMACTSDWYHSVEQRLATGDGQGHGPDIGSAEWKSVVEFKLGIRDIAATPDPASSAWCGHVEALLEQRAQKTSFNCDSQSLSTAEALVCGDVGLSMLDRQLSEVYQQAVTASDSHFRPTLQAEQRGWIKGRNECWKSQTIRQCVNSAYRLRIAELQARYRLVEHSNPVRYLCNNNPADEFVATFFQTEPETAIVERGDSISVMYRQLAASGARYQGRNESLWEHGGKVMISWGSGADAMSCIRSALADVDQRK
ncbi:uncharacterized protein CLV44_13111 [Marinobacterium halophilum]|uniref:Lysozyme inhibitor LprI N-terminal domain-containing protein n=2 Tax=Marinobacterium halophilum TaxID=267374 RepID=A0A2P8EJ70_9GAMM|nr:uncharacterized protein CLV44_13111 [Marinobacterium halophilum]